MGTPRGRVAAGAADPATMYHRRRAIFTAVGRPSRAPRCQPPEAHEEDQHRHGEAQPEVEQADGPAEIGASEPPQHGLPLQAPADGQYGEQRAQARIMSTSRLRKRAGMRTLLARSMPAREPRKSTRAQPMMSAPVNAIGRRNERKSGAGGRRQDRAVGPGARTGLGHEREDCGPAAAEAGGIDSSTHTWMSLRPESNGEEEACGECLGWLG